MKIIIIGLGNFGRSLAINLTNSGHEVFGIDCKMEKVDLLKEHIADVVCMDANNETAYEVLPIHQADLGIVAIGENEGASIVTTAILKKKCKNLRIISRSLSKIHDTILEAMGINDIVHPEQDAAFRLTKQIAFNYALDYFRVDNKYSIAEVFSSEDFIGKKVKNISLIQKYSVSLITVIRSSSGNIKSYFNSEDPERKVIGLVTGDTILKKGDILTIFGSNISIMNFIKDKRNKKK